MQEPAILNGIGLARRARDELQERSSSARPSRAWRAVRTGIYRLSCPALPRSLQSWTESLRRRPDVLLSRSAGLWAVQLAHAMPQPIAQEARDVEVVALEHHHVAI